MSLPDSVVDRVRRVVLGGGDLDSAIRTEVQRANEVTLGARIASELGEHDVRHAVAGFGGLQPLLDDDTIEEIWINGRDHVFVARGGRHERTNLHISTEELRTLVDRMLRDSGRRVDVSQPFVDASLADGSRLHVAIPPITRGEWSVNIRKFPRHVRTLDDLVASGTLDSGAEAIMEESVLAGHTVLVSGATQAGKTTLLCALIDRIPPTERIITIEETFEIASRHPDIVGLQCRAPSIEGTGEITLRRLVKEALRMRPTRLVVGEVRGDEALDLLVALNSGIPGLCTIHANSASDALNKLLTLTQLAGRLGAEFASSAAVRVIDRVVHCRIDAEGRRRVVEVFRPTQVSSNGTVSGEMLWNLR